MFEAPAVGLHSNLGHQLDLLSPWQRWSMKNSGPAGPLGGVIARFWCFLATTHQRRGQHVSLQTLTCAVFHRCRPKPTLCDPRLNGLVGFNQEDLTWRNRAVDVRLNSALCWRRMDCPFIRHPEVQLALLSETGGWFPCCVNMQTFTSPSRWNDEVFMWYRSSRTSLIAGVFNIHDVIPLASALISLILLIWCKSFWSHTGAKPLSSLLRPEFCPQSR